MFFATPCTASATATSPPTPPARRTARACTASATATAHHQPAAPTSPPTARACTASAASTSRTGGPGKKDHSNYHKSPRTRAAWASRIPNGKTCFSSLGSGGKGSFSIIMNPRGPAGAVPLRQSRRVGRLPNGQNLSFSPGAARAPRIPNGKSLPGSAGVFPLHQPGPKPWKIILRTPRRTGPCAYGECGVDLAGTGGPGKKEQFNYHGSPRTGQSGPFAAVPASWKAPQRFKTFLSARASCSLGVKDPQR